MGRSSHQTVKFILILLVLTYGALCFQFDAQQNNKYGNMTIFNTTCNIQTQIDLFLSANSILKCDGSACTLTDGPSSSLKFLDVNGNDLILNLTAAEFTAYQFEKAPISGTRYFVLHFQTTDNSSRVNLIVPVVPQVAASSPLLLDISKLNQVTKAPFTNLASLTDISQGLSLSTFNFLNLRDYSRFYHVTDTTKTETELLSIMIFKTQNSISNFISTSIVSVTTTLNYAQTGNKLCFGSLETSGIFQTHLRESWPLWTAWFAILLFWLYAIIAQSNTLQCFDKRFENNKMTNWSFYSVHFIGHEQFFTRISRISVMLINFSIQGVILAAIFLTLGPLNPPQMIIWAAFIALFATHPVPYLLGGIFLRTIHNTTLQKFKIIKKSRSTAVKQNGQQSMYEAQIDKLQQKLFTMYYWLYIITFVVFVSLWTVSVHLLKQLPRINYTEHHYWISSLSCCFVMEHLIFEPILAVLLGNFKFYQIRGYYYNYSLGEEFKQIEE